MGLTGCHDALRHFWNYGLDSVGLVRRAEEDYYAKEIPERKELRDKNRKICLEIFHSPGNRIQEKGYPNGVSNDWVYTDCMKERGSPLLLYK